ncbi:ABC transporter, transmembrane region [Propionibacterium freudenreichii]|uniref:ABC transporter ATP-binding protein n=1 Tax=Propionibacterium freudenreichii TaxID=1744 RepID=UPI0005A5C36A|nr:ABC transporter ATP-binding protein [Propionibacterium freudenreichii]CEI30674.1 ABC transporter, transmembrane region [Propionibacterium freudenreichii]
MSVTKDEDSTVSGKKNTNKPAANKRPDYAQSASQSRGPGPGGGRAAAVEKAVNFGPSLKRLFGEMKPDRVLIVVVMVLGAIGVAANVYGPKLLGKAANAVFAGVIGKGLPAGVTKDQIVAALTQQGKTDQASMIAKLDVIPGQGIDFTHLGHILLLCLALYVTAAVLTFIQAFIVNRVVQRAVYRMRDQISAKIDRLPLAYFDGQPAGELLSRVTNDMDNVQQSLQQTMSQVINSLLTLIGVIAMMLTVSWQLTLVTLCIVPLSLAVSIPIGKAAQKRFVGMWKSTGELNAKVEESFTGHALVKVFGRRHEVEASFHDTNEEMYKASFGAQFISALIMPANFFIGNLNFVAIAVLGGLRVASGTMQLGDVTAFIQYSRMFTQPLTQITSMTNLLQSGVASAERVFEVLDAGEQTPDEHGSLNLPVKGHVQFDHVDFSYSADQPLINNLSIEAKPGQQIAIVGPTGAGKTTLVNLLERFYDVQGGKIAIDGVDIASVPRHQLRDQLGMVLQDTWLFGGTIHDNIAYGKIDATDDEVIQAAKAAYVDRFVRTLPDGYETKIDEEGSNVSAGEKQLLTIARAFISDPSILILDEATSSVDTRTEVLVQKAMNRLRSGRTSFVIAHRLSTIRDADLILVMEHGAIVEQGTPEGLIAAQGAYYRLYESQFSAAEQPEELAGSATSGAKRASS